MTRILYAPGDEVVVVKETSAGIEYHARGIVRCVPDDGGRVGVEVRSDAVSDGLLTLRVPHRMLRPKDWKSDPPTFAGADARGNLWFNDREVVVPPGWAIRIEDGKVEYMLALVADSPELAEKMAAEEAERFVMAFAEDVAAWIGDDAPGHDWPPRSEASHEYARMRVLAGASEKDELSFEKWVGQQILRAARKERTLP